MTRTALQVIVALLFVFQAARAQDIDSLLGSMTDEETTYTTATFKSSRIINGHSVGQMKAGELDVRFHHRFGRVNSGAYELWGLDQASIFFGFEYGLNDWLMLGVGRSSYQKTYNGFAKMKLLRQSTGEVTMPVTVSAYAGADVQTLHWQDAERENYFSSRLSYVLQALVARKFSDELSLQLTPTLVHRNLVPTELDNNDMFALGLGGRYKITNRITLNAEYFLNIRPPVEGSLKPVNSLSLGVDIETGGHVFTIVVTNSETMIERGFITETTDTWSDGGIHLGFNLSRVFTL
jgi:hypothetical protein